jgi:hypothetical protein
VVRAYLTDHLAAEQVHVVGEGARQVRQVGVAADPPLSVPLDQIQCLARHLRNLTADIKLRLAKVVGERIQAVLGDDHDVTSVTVTRRLVRCDLDSTSRTRNTRATRSGSNDARGDQ